MIARVRKAIVAGVGAGVTAFVTLMADGITPEEAGAIASAVVAVGLATYFVPNKAAG